MARPVDRILTTHVGSLVRSSPLYELLVARENGEPYDHERLEAELDRGVDEVVRKQLGVGLDIINDGEFRKTKSWMSYINDRLSGFELREGGGSMMETLNGKDWKDFAEFYDEYNKAQMPPRLSVMSWAITGPIRYTGHAEVQADIAAMKQAIAGLDPIDVFMPAVAPASVVPGGLDQHLTTDKAFLFQLAEALREEYKAIVDAGFVLQIDDAFIATTYDVMVPPGTLQDFRKWAELRIDALNHALEGIPADRTRYHVCWGSWNGPHSNDVEVKDIIDLILKVNVGGYSLEMANPRHEHEWRVWETVRLPPGKTLIPGVVTHSTNIVEHPELVAERIVRLAKLVGRENVIGGTDCGFAQAPHVRRTHPSIMWAKLGSLAEGARIATKELWGRRAAA